jgi:electron transfer flavoprotein alpha subunit
MRPGPTSGDLPIEVATLFGFAVGRLMSKSKLIDIREAARTLGVSVGALRKRVQRGHLPRGAVVYEGRRYYFRPERLGV